MNRPPDSRHRPSGAYGEDDKPGSSVTSPPVPGPVDQVVFWVVSWVLLVGLYLLLVVDSIDVSELVTGAVAAAVGATAATTVRSQRLVSFRPCASFSTTSSECLPLL
jgi:hypothetical protein